MTETLKTATVVEVVDHLKDSTWVLVDKQWHLGQLDVTLCRECYKIKKGVFPRPIDLYVTQLPEAAVYDLVVRGGVAVIHRKLLAWLQPHLPAHVIGDCYLRGKRLAAYRSMYFQDQLLVRGGKRTQYYCCGTCGALGTNPSDQYILRQEIPAGDVYQAFSRSLYLSASVARVFPWTTFETLTPFVIPIRDEPLPDDPLPHYREGGKDKYFVWETPSLPPPKRRLP